MFDLLLRDPWARPGLALLLGLAIAGQSVLWQMIQTRYGLQLVDRGFRRVFEGFVLAYLLLQLAALGTVADRVGAGVIDPGSQLLRWLAWAGLVAVVVLGQRLLHSIEPLVLLVVTALSLPVLDGLPAPIPSVTYCGVSAYLLVRSVWLALAHWQRLRTGISAMSIQEAIDQLPSGLMFVRPDAGVVLINSQMRQVMAALTGRVHRHAEGFLTETLRGLPDEGVDRSELDGAPVFGLADGTHWMLRSTDLVVDGRPHQQVVASDVTLAWQKVQELRTSQDALEASAWQLQAEIDGLYEACKSDELVKARLRTHDIIGQRVAMMLRRLRDGTVTDRAELAELVAGLRTELENRPADREPADELEMLRSVMADSGVSVLGPDRLPPDPGAAALAVDIVREAISNAIKHGSATEVRIDCRPEADIWRLDICNNGFTYSDRVVEGDGLRGMRYRLNEYGGSLQVAVGPRFCLHATLRLPGGDE